ncbi:MULTISPECIES: LamG-like jellyroll fold domain-containing protein [Streptomyces]|uniref:LamG-like jellyroll fold domain-containing protein n=1 Tax=Streptomyces doudnae TaxID=3075536 RepID=A0ABD5EJ69_9ACTN|nr:MULTISPECIES: LamG-like jellyroll fold domain-containing protein [unclassified Streptomyces]MDT0433895.1 LamG-like jellyroll fold domain-containing protein [Streptomyces sp. DSM 41981]MYQ64675.1 DNRLRE domain-containing protein [Streptomyces sp. SID4950]SCD83922.1 Concanavalin A-like lectin/glucanases superfamily protein [Streptomyces sp. SolWspMP-5a-2]
MTGMWARTRGRGRAVAALLGVALTFGIVPDLTERAVAEETSAPRGAQPATETAGRSEAEALAEAKRTGEPVEVSSARGESREVFATPEGDLEAREYLRPVWTRQAGGWARVDTDLVESGEGMVAAKASTIGVEFSGGGGTAPLVRIHRAGRELSLSWPARLPQPRLEGAVATYPSVLPDVDLRMTAQPDGFSQLLVVKSAQAAASPELAELRLKLSADGLDVQETDEGGLRALDAGAKGAVFEAPKPMMWDSSPGESSSGSVRSRSASATGTSASAQSGGNGEPGAAESGKLAPVRVEVPAGQEELVLTPDADVLKGDDTTYPVYIDPQWYSPRASAWTMASKYWASSPQWKFNGDADAGLGYCNWSYCNPSDTKRLFYRVPVSAFAGKSVLSAEFVVRNTWSASCSARSVELWQTKAISSSTTWNSQNASGFWTKQLASQSFAYGYSGCAAKDAEFNVKAAVQAAADGRDSTMTFGLRAGSESDAYGWKRFSDKAYLRVKYNRPPPQIKMSQLTMEYGGMCKNPSAAARVRSLGTVQATNVTDPDTDNVAVHFQASWDAGDGKGVIARWMPAVTPFKKSGSSFQISLPSTLPENKQIYWQARSYDGAQYSPWSSAGDPTACYFVYDRTVPKAPTITSGEYPASDPGNPDDPWFDGVGKYGSFAIKAADSDVTQYRFGVNEDPISKNTLGTSAGAARTAAVLPATAGVNHVTAQAFDKAGNGSEIRTYEFRVKGGQPERATWQLDDAAGATSAKGSTPERTAELKGGAQPGVAGAKGTAVSFDGVDDYAVTDIPTVDTSTGFSVSAWAKLSTVPGHAAIIAAQPGNHAPGFELYYSNTYDRWAFNQYTSDTAGAGLVRAMQPSAGGAKAGVWTHLVGTFSATSKDLKLYVNGQLAGSATYDSPWDARRGLQLGAGSYGGVPGSFFPGAIDEVQVFDKPVSASEVTELYGKNRIASGRPARAIFTLDDPVADTTGRPTTTITGAAQVPDATLSGGPSFGAAGVAGTALSLDGTDDYATTGRPLLNNQTSFAVSAWVKLPKTKPDHAAIAVTQAGTHKPGLELYYSSAYDRWAVNQYSADATDATPIRAMQAEGVTAFGDTWTHLVGVHDPVVDKLVLYVNGVEAGSTALKANWYAGGAVQIGAGSYDGKPSSFFPGQIDDVRLFDRSVSADEVVQLFRQRPLVKSRWTFEQTVGTAPVTVPDAAGTANALTMRTGARPSDSGVIGSGAMELDGVTGYASAASVPVDTSGSFTMTAWAQAAAMPDGAVALTSAEGGTRSAFTVRFVPNLKDPENTPGRWQLTVADEDATDAEVVRVDNGDFYDARDWNHLALVYDGFAKQVRLYVNGGLAEVACPDADGDGAGDNDACTDLVPWAENALAFKATSLQIGRTGIGTGAGSYFPGLVDDVWTFQGALTDTQVEKLAASWFGLPTEIPGG